MGTLIQPELTLTAAGVVTTSKVFTFPAFEVNDIELGLFQQVEEKITGQTNDPTTGDLIDIKETQVIPLRFPLGIKSSETLSAEVSFKVVK